MYYTHICVDNMGFKLGYFPAAAGIILFTPLILQSRPRCGTSGPTPACAREGRSASTWRPWGWGPLFWSLLVVYHLLWYHYYVHYYYIIICLLLLHYYIIIIIIMIRPKVDRILLARASDVCGEVLGKTRMGKWNRGGKTNNNEEQTTNNKQ